MLSSVTELHAYIDPGQLTTELGGTQEYCHDSWISHRTVNTHNAILFYFCLKYIISLNLVWTSVYSYPIAPSSAGNRSIRPHGEDDGSDAAGIRH